MIRGAKNVESGSIEPPNPRPIAPYPGKSLSSRGAQSLIVELPTNTIPPGAGNVSKSALSKAAIVDAHVVGTVDQDCSERARVTAHDEVAVEEADCVRVDEELRVIERARVTELALRVAVRVAEKLRVDVALRVDVDTELEVRDRLPDRVEDCDLVRVIVDDTGPVRASRRVRRTIRRRCTAVGLE
jgi:hypothetical protein